MLIWCDGRVGKLLETGDERATEALEAVAVGRDGGMLAGVKVLANLLGSMDAMIEVGDESRDGPFEVDIVLP